MSFVSKLSYSIQPTASQVMMLTRLGKDEALLTGLGASIAARRVELGLSQEEVAQKAFVHRTYLSDVERGVRNVSILTLDRIANALDIPLAALFAWIIPAGKAIRAKRRG